MQPVTDSPYGINIFFIRGKVLSFFIAQVADMDIQRIIFVQILRIPDTLKQIGLGKYFVGISRMSNSSMASSFAVRSSSVRSGRPYFFSVKNQVLVLQALRNRRLKLNPAQAAFYPGQYLFHIKRLGNIIIRAWAQRNRFYSRRFPCGNNDYGQGYIACVYLQEPDLRSGREA